MKSWVILAILLVAIIASGATIIGFRYHSNPPIEITIATPEPYQGHVYVYGEVNMPGIYPFRTEDSIKDIFYYSLRTSKLDLDLNQIEKNVNMFLPDYLATTAVPHRVGSNAAGTNKHKVSDIALLCKKEDNSVFLSYFKKDFIFNGEPKNLEIEVPRFLEAVLR